jgi:hypothetical protein
MSQHGSMMRITSEQTEPNIQAKRIVETVLDAVSKESQGGLGFSRQLAAASTFSLQSRSCTGRRRSSPRGGK